MPPSGPPRRRFLAMPTLARKAVLDKSAIPGCGHGDLAAGSQVLGFRDDVVHREVAPEGVVHLILGESTAPGALRVDLRGPHQGLAPRQDAEPAAEARHPGVINPVMLDAAGLDV